MKKLMYFKLFMDESHIEADKHDFVLIVAADIEDAHVVARYLRGPDNYLLVVMSHTDDEPRPFISLRGTAWLDEQLLVGFTPYRNPDPNLADTPMYYISALQIKLNLFLDTIGSE